MTPKPTPSIAHHLRVDWLGGAGVDRAKLLLITDGDAQKSVCRVGFSGVE